MAQNMPVMVKPHHIDGIPYLEPQLKQQYKQGLTNLWQLLENSPAGSAQYIDAETKIRNASMKLMQKIKNGSNRPTSGGGSASRPNQPQTAPGRAAPGNTTQVQAQPQAQNQSAGGNSANIQQTNNRARQDKEMIVYPPPNVTPANAEQYKQDFRQQFQNLQTQQQSCLNTGRRLQAIIQEAQKTGQPLPPNTQTEFITVKEKLDNLKKQIHNLVTRNNEHAVAAGAIAQPQSQPQANESSGQNAQQVRQQQLPQENKLVSNHQQSTNPPAQPQGAFSRQPQVGHNQQGVPAQTSQVTTPGPQQTPQTATQTQPSQAFPPNNTAQTPIQQSQRPQVNIQQAQAQIAQQQAQNTPTSAIPQSASQVQQQQRPQALTHQAAMSQAADSYARTQAQQQPPAQGQQMPNGLPYGQSQSGSRQNTPGSAYPNLQTTQSGSTSTKFPIPKTLQLDPRTQTAAPGPPSRPTLMNQGMMSQPGIQRPPTYTLEGEGDRVLSKRKLDELVRQVTGSAPETSGESSSVLTPEVEESMMQVADDFVDDVIIAACRLAKLRPTQTLDIRDIQIVLERNYGIRIPGYSLDEVRTVRKFQPAPGWHSKMQAVQAGKVMGNRDP